MTGGWAAPGAPDRDDPTDGPHRAPVPSPSAPPPPDGQRSALQRELVERTPLFPLRPLALGEILGAATRIYRLRPRTLLALSAIVFGVVYALSTVLTGASLLPMLSSLQSSLDTPSGSVPSTTLGDGEFLWSSLAGAGSGFLSLLGTQLVTVAIAAIAIGEATGRPVSDAAAWRLMGRRGVRAILAELLVGAVSLVAFAVLVGLGALPLIVAQEAQWWTIAPIVLGFLVGVLALLYIRMRTVLTTPALSVEDLGPLAAIRRSLALTRGRRLWRVLGISLLLSLLAYVAIQVVSGMISVIGMVAYAIILVASGFSQITLAAGVLLVSTMLAAYVATVLVQPFLSAGQTTLYADQRMRHEAWDLELDRRAREHRAETAPV